MTARNGWNGLAGRIGRGALALGAVLAAGGCPPSRPPARVEVPRTVPEGIAYKDAYVFKIRFDEKGCASSATVEGTNCDRPDCVRVKRGATTVSFEADPRDKQFVLHFDPFAHRAIESKDGVVEGLKAMSLPDKAEQGKTYTFTVVAKSECSTPLDPQIILD